MAAMEWLPSAVKNMFQMVVPLAETVEKVQMLSLK